MYTTLRVNKCRTFVEAFKITPAAQASAPCREASRVVSATDRPLVAAHAGAPSPLRIRRRRTSVGRVLFVLRPSHSVPPVSPPVPSRLARPAIRLETNSRAVTFSMATGLFLSPVCFCSTTSLQSARPRFLRANTTAVDAPGPAEPRCASATFFLSQNSCALASPIFLA
jgi:hypothetical protein